VHDVHHFTGVAFEGNTVVAGEREDLTGSRGYFQKFLADLVIFVDFSYLLSPAGMDYTIDSVISNFDKSKAQEPPLGSLCNPKERRFNILSPLCNAT